MRPGNGRRRSAANCITSGRMSISPCEVAVCSENTIPAPNSSHSYVWKDRLDEDLDAQDFEKLRAKFGCRRPSTSFAAGSGIPADPAGRKVLEEFDYRRRRFASAADSLLLAVAVRTRSMKSPRAVRRSAMRSRRAWRADVAAPTSRFIQASTDSMSHLSLGRHVAGCRRRRRRRLHLSAPVTFAPMTESVALPRFGYECHSLVNARRVARCGIC